MSSGLDHARILRERRRYEEAIAAARQYLSQQPDDYQGYLELALCYYEQSGSLQDALDAIDRAISLNPIHPGLHAIRSGILHGLDRFKDALAAADKAIALDPEFAPAWFYRGNAQCGLRLLTDAEESANKALELDPDLQSASNLLSMILRMQQRFDEAEVNISRHLERDPEDPWTFATAGWTALNRGDQDKAQELFREALRLNPEMEHARLGLREAYKARSPVYRLFLKWCFFLQRYSEKNQWLIIIGIYLGYRFGVVLLQTLHPLAAVPLIAGYLLFAFGGWLASGLGNFLLLKDPLARLTLNQREKLDGLTVGGFFFGGLAVLVVGALFFPLHVTFLGMALMGAAIPASLIFGEVSALGQKIFIAVTLAVVTCAIASQFQLAPPGSDSVFNATGGKLMTFVILAVVGTSWLGMIPSLRKSES
ncbi:tetratricopeptide repeat protein [Haloferula rosea]|uniref:Tetratricopeptide repeat protein n=1 Tax=Haloferula rosea TaxID=490093 RepID=A0A934RF56_9BACT|nr:tetratricopeptide repeat protein [Haloferula rosea]MBK1827265.1 tetratricopeptide repeat protein [Haloferula rosea]